MIYMQIILVKFGWSCNKNKFTSSMMKESVCVCVCHGSGPTNDSPDERGKVIFLKNYLITLMYVRSAHKLNRNIEHQTQNCH